MGLSMIAVTIAVVGLVLNIIGMIIFAVWNVGRIKATTEVLVNSLNAWSSAVKDLKTVVEKLETDLSNVHTRVTVLETLKGMGFDVKNVDYK